MKQARRPLIFAMALFTLAITLDRVGPAAIGGYAYALALGAIAAPLLLPAARRTSRWASQVTALVVLGATWAFFGAGPFGDSPIHLAALEAAFVAIETHLGRELAAALDRLDDLFAAAAFGDSPALDLEGPVAASEIHTEFARGRRHDRPLSVTVITPAPTDVAAALERASVEVSRAIASRYLFGTLSRAVAGQLRRSDLLFEHRAGGRLVILSPETDAQGLQPLVERVQHAAERAGIRISSGTASFPDDGVGFETLVARAEDAIATEPRLRAVEHGSGR